MQSAIRAFGQRIAESDEGIRGAAGDNGFGGGAKAFSIM
jgi:hypothetical protein